MGKSILNEIDRLEGIALARMWARPIVPMAGVLEDCNDARVLAENIFSLQEERSDYFSDIAALRDQIRDIELEIVPLVTQYKEAIYAIEDAQAHLDNLMASLSARLER